MNGRSLLCAAALWLVAIPANAQETGGAVGSWGSSGTAGEEAAQEPAFTPEEQVQTGKFLTALEVKPILTATKGSWVAVREYDGQDLLYFTQILSWRCGLHQIRYAVNDGAETVFEAEPCHVDTAMPNAIVAEDILPYLAFPLGSVETVAIRLIYDDGTEDGATFPRADVLMP